MAALDTLNSNINPGEPVAPTEVKGALSTEKPVAVPSPTDFVSIKGPKGTSMTLDPNSSDQILQRMQDFIDQRTNKSKLDTFSDALTRSSMLIHPEALNQYDKAEAEKAKETFDMQMQLAQYRTALAQNEAYRNRVNQLLSNGTQSAAAPQGGGAGTASQTVSTTGGQSFNFKQLPPEIQAAAAMQPDYASFIKVIDDWAKKHAEQAQKLENDITLAGEQLKVSPAGLKQETYTVKTPQGIIQVDLDANEWANVKKTGKLPDNTPVIQAGPGAMAPSPTTEVSANTGIQPVHIAQVESGNRPGAIGPNVPGQGTAKSAMQVMDATSIDPGFGVKPAQLTGDPKHDEAERVRVGTEYFNALKSKYGNDTLASVAYNMGPKATDDWIAAGADINKLPAETRDYVAKAHLTSATSNVAKPAPTTQQQPAAGIGPNEKQIIAKWAAQNGPQNNAQFKQKDEELKSAREADRALAQETHKAQLKSTEQESAAAGKYISKLETEGARAHEVAQQADSIIKHASEHPNEFGWSKQSNLLSPILNAPKIIPHYGKDISHGMEEFIQPFAGKDVAARRDFTDTQAAKLGFDFAAQTFAGTGARLGVGLEQMAAKAKGLGVEQSASTNILNAQLIKIAYNKAEDQAQAWNRYKDAVPNPDPYQFMQSPQNKAIEAKWNAQLDKLEGPLRKAYPQYFNDQTINAQDKRKPLSSFHK